jgi:2-hydroxychromene-2-carboxylate isomerase
MPKIEFHFDFGSPNAYLAHRVIPEIERRTGVKLDYVPVLLGGVFKLTGNRSPAEAFAGIRNKPEYERLETERFIARHGIVGFRRNPFFPVNTVTLMRGAIAAERLGVFERYVEEVYRHPLKVKAIGEAEIKTDKIDATILSGQQAGLRDLPSEPALLPQHIGAQGPSLNP